MLKWYCIAAVMISPMAGCLSEAPGVVESTPVPGQTSADQSVAVTKIVDRGQSTQTLCSLVEQASAGGGVFIAGRHYEVEGDPGWTYMDLATKTAWMAAIPSKLTVRYVGGILGQGNVQAVVSDVSRKLNSVSEGSAIGLLLAQPPGFDPTSKDPNLSFLRVAGGTDGCFTEDASGGYTNGESFGRTPLALDMIGEYFREAFAQMSTSGACSLVPPSEAKTSEQDTLPRHDGDGNAYAVPVDDAP